MTFHDILVIPIQKAFEEYRQKMNALAEAEEKCAGKWRESSIAWELSSWWWLQSRDCWLEYIKETTEPDIPE